MASSDSNFSSKTPLSDTDFPPDPLNLVIRTSGPTTSIPPASDSNAAATSSSLPPLEPFSQYSSGTRTDISLAEGDRIVEFSANGRYAKLNCILGKGAYKVVYKAIDREEGYEVAWNCFQTSKAEFNELSQEIEILKRVRHPNIINFHECWHNNMEFIFVTELMTSGTLREYIRKLQTPNMKIVKRWSRQILKGLLYLHSHDPPIIHRDIKCDNIFINGAHGEVKIGDMGTAKMKMGKKYTVIEFMAPEMYDERGYSEKVDVYAFGMCLLEMVTGEYPYSECTNAAQIYKKVTQGIKPDCISKIVDPEVFDLITRCLTDEEERWTVTQVLEHTFLTVEPEVVLVSTNENKSHLTLQVVFKGMDKLAVKFEFNTDTDTAEEVVNEMIEESVLSHKYRALITHEINRILRDLSKITTMNENNSVSNANHLNIVSAATTTNGSMDSTSSSTTTPWRRIQHDSMKNELERAKIEAHLAKERAVEAEKKAEQSEFRARLAEEKTRHQVPNIESAVVSASPVLSASSFFASTASVTSLIPDYLLPSQADTFMGNHPDISTTPAMPTLNTSSNEISAIDIRNLGSTDDMLPLIHVLPLKDYHDDQPIEDLVSDTATTTNRGLDKASEWMVRLRAQDIMTVGDLRDLHDEDWVSLGLTVFASRALRNALHGKGGRNASPKTLIRSATASSTPISSQIGEGDAMVGGVGRNASGSVIPSTSVED